MYLVPTGCSAVMYYSIRVAGGSYLLATAGGTISILSRLAEDNASVCAPSGFPYLSDILLPSAHDVVRAESAL
jgi:hypothetical protein